MKGFSGGKTVGGDMNITFCRRVAVILGILGSSANL
jgi:hypothetical protein